jgi:tRNA(Arg) A34 adenosine deaminase TadA
MIRAMAAKPDVPLVVTVPGWVDEVVSEFSGPLETDEDRMGLAIALSRHNIERGGGPFGAVVFLGERLVGAGVNRVVDTGFSIAHAEIVAMMRAQRFLAESPPGWERDAAGAVPRYSLVTTAEPCCQCFGALVWSGIEHLVCGATTDDAEAIGFDEGPKPDAWVTTLVDRRIQVTQQVRRDEARAVLNDYVRRGGPIYGSRHPPS